MKKGSKIALVLGGLAVVAVGVVANRRLRGKEAVEVELHTVVAKDIAFDTAALTAPANTPFQIQFDNQDASIPHDVAIHEGSQSGAEVFKGDVVTGPAQKTYDVPPLKAGSYAFFCTIHPNMAGTLTVQ